MLLPEFKMCAMICFALQIKPLVKPTRIIMDETNLSYSWHDFVSKGMNSLFHYAFQFLLLSFYA